MIYLPNQLMRWWTYSKDGDALEPKFNKFIGWYSNDLTQSTFYEMVERYHLIYLNAFDYIRSMETKVYEALGYRDFSISELKYMFPEYSREYGRLADITVQTALNRLMRQGKVTRVLHSRGWFQWYVYSRVE